MMPGMQPAAKAEDHLMQSRISTMAVAGSYYAQSPGGNRVQVVAQPRFVTVPGGYPGAYGTAPAPGPSFVQAPPRAAQPVVYSGSAPAPAYGAPAAYGAPVMQFRPSYVAAQPASAAVLQAAAMAAGAPPNAVRAAPAPTVVSVVRQGQSAMGSAVAPAAQPTVVMRAAPAPEPPAPAPEPTEPPVTVEYVEALERRLADLELVHARKTSSALVFIKPHAVTEEMKEYVRGELATRGIFILSEGTIQAEEIDQQQLIDTHYGAIAAKAVKLSPDQLSVQLAAQDEFERAFGLPWADAVAQGLVYNAAQGAEALGISGEELGARWGTLTKGVDMLKFGGGFYCGKIDDIYVLNGFYMNMRSKYTAPGSCIYYFETEWDARALSWRDFRAKVIGATDPAAAEEGSLRSVILSNFGALGLHECPDTGNNGIHASAGPFEALLERSNWLGIPIESDFFGRALLATGVPSATLQEWCEDPAVTYEGAERSLFDLLEDLNPADCLRVAAGILAEPEPTAAPAPEEDQAPAAGEDAVMADDAALADAAFAED